MRGAETYHNIGRAYRAQGQWTAAIAAMRAAMLHAIDNETKSTYQLDLAVTLICESKLRACPIGIDKGDPTFPLARLAAARAQFLKGVCLSLPVPMGRSPGSPAKLHRRR